MAKKKKIHKIEMGPDEKCVVTQKLDTVMFFRESAVNPLATNVELVLPDENDLPEGAALNSINLATAIGIKLKVDQTFAPNLLQWLADYIQSQQSGEGQVDN